MKQSLKRSQIEAFAVALERAKNAKSLAEEEFNSLHSRFRFDDANGAAWTVGIHTHTSGTAGMLLAGCLIHRQKLFTRKKV